MMLVISVLLALVPLLGIVWIVIYGSITTVDGLFMSLILAGHVRHSGLERSDRDAQAPHGTRKLAAATATASGGLRQRGKVESVQFYESGVGQPNKSVVTLVGRRQRVETVSAGGRHAKCSARGPESRSHLPQGKRTQRAGATSIYLLKRSGGFPAVRLRR